MSTCTPVYGLPYATGADRPCDIGSTLCSFNSAVQTQLDRLSGIVNRTAATIPMAKVAATVPFTLNFNSPGSVVLAFDTVQVDTDNMFASSSPAQLTINRPGVYGSFAQIYSTSTGAGIQAASTVRVDLSTFSGAFMLDNLGYASGTPVFQAGTGIWVATAGSTVTMTYSTFIQGTDTVTLQYAELGLYWLSDTP